MAAGWAAGTARHGSLCDVGRWRFVAFCCFFLGVRTSPPVSPQEYLRLQGREWRCSPRGCSTDSVCSWAQLVPGSQTQSLLGSGLKKSALVSASGIPAIGTQWLPGAQSPCVCRWHSFLLSVEEPLPMDHSSFYCLGDISVISPLLLSAIPLSLSWGWVFVAFIFVVLFCFLLFFILHLLFCHSSRVSGRERKKNAANSSAPSRSPGEHYFQPNGSFPHIVL